MTPANAATLAHLQNLRAAARAALNVVNLASANGTMDEWMAARKVCAPLEAAALAEERRIIAAGFGGDSDFEFAVLGRLGRRHDGPRAPTWSDLQVRS